MSKTERNIVRKEAVAAYRLTSMKRAARFMRFDAHTNLSEVKQREGLPSGLYRYVCKLQ